MEARKQWNELFKVLKEKFAILKFYIWPKNIFLKMIFSDRQKLRIHLASMETENVDQL